MTIPVLSIIVITVVLVIGFITLGSALDKAKRDVIDITRARDRCEADVEFLVKKMEIVYREKGEASVRIDLLPSQLRNFRANYDVESDSKVSIMRKLG